MSKISLWHNIKHLLKSGTKFQLASLNYFKVFKNIDSKFKFITKKDWFYMIEIQVGQARNAGFSASFPLNNVQQW